VTLRTRLATRVLESKSLLRCIGNIGADRKHLEGTDEGWSPILPSPVKTRTHIYTFPLETDADRSAVETALVDLSTELHLTHPLRLKGGHRGLITVPDVTPDDTWSAIDRVVPGWQQLFLPRSAE
jgi:hypothetical protein